MSTISDVAKLAGVSPAVVSRLLNHDESLRIRQETRESVWAAVKELDYSPNYAARALRQNSSNAIGLAVHDITNPVYGEIVAGAQAAATQRGHVLLLADIEGLADEGSAFRRMLRGGAISGMLIQSAGSTADATVSEMASREVRTVLVNERCVPYPSVALDDFRGAYLAARHLLEMGHTRIAHLSLGRSQRSYDRSRGFLEALREHGVEAGFPEVVGGFAAETGRAGMLELLSRHGLPSAIVVSNALAAIGALAASREASFSVPEDVSIVAIHDMPFCEFMSPPLTVVKMPLREMGAQGVNLLLAEERVGKDTIVVTRPEPELIVRASVKEV